MSRGVQYKTTNIIAALEEKRGAVHLAAEVLGCVAKTIQRRAERVQAVQDVIDKYRGRRSDLAEIKLEQAIMNGEPWAIQFQLRTQGKSRGYSEKIETENHTVVEWVYGNDEAARDVAGATREAEGDYQ